MKLQNIQEEIDNGGTATLHLLPDDKFKTEVTIWIKRVPDGYQRTAFYPLDRPDKQHRPARIWPEWGMLLEGIDGVQTTSDRWEVTK